MVGKGKDHLARCGGHGFGSGSARSLSIAPEEPSPSPHGIALGSTRTRAFLRLLASIGTTRTQDTLKLLPFVVMATGGRRATRLPAPPPGCSPCSPWARPSPAWPAAWRRTTLVGVVALALCVASRSLQRHPLDGPATNITMVAILGVTVASVLASAGRLAPRAPARRRPLGGRGRPAGAAAAGAAPGRARGGWPSPTPRPWPRPGSAATCTRWSPPRTGSGSSWATCRARAWRRWRRPRWCSAPSGRPPTTSPTCRAWSPGWRTR